MLERCVSGLVAERLKVYYHKQLRIISLTTAVALLLSTTLAPSNSILAYQNPISTPVVDATSTINPASSTVTNNTSLANTSSNASTTDPINVREYVEQYFAKTPILIRIAGCESQFRQFDKNGNVLRGNIVHQDVGVMQINETYQGALASALGYNIYTLQGNVAYAKWLYEQEGTQPWMSSNACWGR